MFNVFIIINTSKAYKGACYISKSGWRTNFLNWSFKALSEIARLVLITLLIPNINSSIRAIRSVAIVIKNLIVLPHSPSPFFKEKAGS